MDSQVDGLHRPFRHREEQDDETEQSTAYQDHALNGIRPDHRPQAAQHRIDNDGDRREDDHRMDVPPHQDIHRHGQQIEDRPHPRNLRQQVTGGGVESCPRPKLLFQEGVG